MKSLAESYVSGIESRAERDLEATMARAQRIRGERAEPASSPRPLPEAPTPDEFDMTLLPDTLRPWVADIAERMQCPPDMIAVPAMVAAGSILGRKIGVRPQGLTDWLEVPNLWGMVVSRPGTMKSPAMSQALAPLRRLQGVARDAHKAAMAEHARGLEHHELRAKAAKVAARKALAKDAHCAIDLPDEPDAPMLRRYIANDSNIASLGELLMQNPNGLLVERDELVGLLRGLDSEDKAEERAFYLTGWNGCAGYTFDRIMRGLNLHIPAVTLSVIGGAQPARVSEYLRHAVRGTAGDDGLMQRFSLLVWPDQRGEWRDVDRWPDSTVRTRANEAYGRLDAMTPDDAHALRDENEPVPFLRFAPDALAAFREWRATLEQRLQGDSLHPAMASHLSKYRKAVPTLALIAHLIDGGTGPIGESPTVRALAWADYLESHAVRAYDSVTDATATTARLILRRLDKLPDAFGARDVYRPQWSGLTDAKTVGEALEMLVDYGYLTDEIHDTGGRQLTLYQLHARARQ